MDFNGKQILITGGSGFLAQALVSRILSTSRPGLITLVGRDESKLMETQSKFTPIVTKIMAGDIANRGFVDRIMRQKEQVFHLAGFKYLPLAEEQSQECIETNVMGSKNILDASMYTNPEFVIGISTDKAYNPSSCYGMTKRLMEYLFAQYERDKGDLRTQYRIARYGNVLGSTGSVIPVWRRAIEKGEPIKITDPDMTRFYFTVEDAVDTIFQCLEQQTDAAPYIPKMKAVRLGDLADALAGSDYPKEIIGNRGNEKMNEGMADGNTSDVAEKYTIDEIKSVIANI